MTPAGKSNPACPSPRAANNPAAETMPNKKAQQNSGRSEHGNMLFIILLAVVLVGLLTAAIMNSGSGENSNIDRETLIIKTSEVQRYAAEIERAVQFIMQNGKISESDIRFAHPDNNADYGDLSADTDPSDQVFSPSGGGAAFRAPPEGINDGSSWEFLGTTHLPGVGSDKADLIMILPGVTAAFCDRINELNNQTAVPVDKVDCLYPGAAGRFDNGTQFSAVPNTVDESTFEQDPTINAARTAIEACVICSADSKRYYYHVLMAR